MIYFTATWLILSVVLKETVRCIFICESLSVYFLYLADDVMDPRRGYSSFNIVFISVASFSKSNFRYRSCSYELANVFDCNKSLQTFQFISQTFAVQLYTPKYRIICLTG